MRYLVFSDVHANLEALNTVLAAGEQRGVDAYLFLGDLVGYGPNPMECIQKLMGLENHGGFAWVAGNHDLVARGEIQPEGYSVEAIKTLEWTRQQIEAEPWAKKFLAGPHLSAQINNEIWMTHDSLIAPGCGGYHRYPQKAKDELARLALDGGTICFYGHTHVMRTELLRGEQSIVMVPMEPHVGEGIDPSPLQMKLGERAWASSGSVGFPTNPKRLAEYLILDDGRGAHWKLEKYAVAYPRERTRARVRKVLAEPCGEAVADRIARWL